MAWNSVIIELNACWLTQGSFFLLLFAMNACVKLTYVYWNERERGRVEYWFLIEEHEYSLLSVEFIFDIYYYEYYESV